MVKLMPVVACMRISAAIFLVIPRCGHFPAEKFGASTNYPYFCRPKTTIRHPKPTAMNHISLHLARLILPLLLLPLLAACHPGRHARMQAELAHLQALNQADSLLINDSLAQALALYFDDHGTPNEQMEAHYLLGRTYADRGEAPAAIAAYHDAIDRADTTAADCDYRQLCRVYSQMAKIFYQQNLVKDNLDALELSIKFGLKGKDTISAINPHCSECPNTLLKNC